MKTPTLENFQDADQVRDAVRSRYGAVAQQDSEQPCGCGPTCCDKDKKSRSYDAALGYSGDEIASAPAGANLGLGCGNPVAVASIRAGETIVDLGSGAGFDCFIAARQLAGTGKVIGVDRTAEMIAKARAGARKSGYTNVEFRLGEIEALPVADASVDLIMSNCVINLSPEKPRVLAEAFRVLKSGGRLSIADVVATKPLPEKLRHSFASIGACVGGAVLVDDYRAMLAAAGFQRIEIAIKADSRALINEWVSEARAGDYVVSALISAYKP